MHQSKLTIKVVEVEEAALSGGDLEKRSFGSWDDLEAAAGFKGLQDGDQAFLDRLALEDLLGELFLVVVSFKDQEGPALGVGEGLGVVGDPAREGFSVDFEVLDKPILMVE